MQANKLFAGTVFFAEKTETDISEDTAAYLQIPVVVVCPSPDHGKGFPQRRFNRLQPFNRALPLFVPQTETAPSRKR